MIHITYIPTYLYVPTCMSDQYSDEQFILQIYIYIPTW